MKTFILVFTLLIVAGFSNGQEKTDAMLFGDVKAKESGEHIPYASVFIQGTSHGTMTDGTGHFKLANLPVGDLVLMVRTTGYKTYQTTIHMTSGKALTLFIELETDIIQLESMVITGTRTQHTVKDVPVKTALISRHDITKRNAANLFQALENTPGIRVENQCQSCNFSMIRMQGLGAEHTQVLINGQPLYSGLAGVYGLQQLSTIDVNRIEVVKGAGSALYGSSAVAGAINIITSDPSMIPSTSLDVQFGNHQTNRYDIASSMRNEKGNVGLHLFARRLTEGIIDETGEGSTLMEVHKPDGISDRVATNLTNAGFGLFITDAFMKNDKLVIRGKSIVEKRDGGIITDDYYKNPFTDGTESILTDRYETELNYTKKFSKGSEIQFSVAYVYHHRTATNDSYLNDYMTMHGDTLPDLRDMRPYLASEHTISSTFTWGRKFGAHQILLGLQGYSDHLKESGMYVVVDPVSIHAGTSYQSTAFKQAFETGAFIQDEWRVNHKLTLVPGVRIDRHTSGEQYTSNQTVFVNDQFPKTSFEETSINPRLAAKYLINKRFTLRANVGTGFRAPYGFSEDLHLCSGSPRVWKSSQLKPETSISYNYSVDYYGDQTTISLNLFRTNLRNKIGFTIADAQVASLGYDYQWKNIDDAFVQGIETSIQTKIRKRWTAGLDLTINQGEYSKVREDWKETPYAEMSRAISRFPGVTGNISLDYRHKSWNIYASGSYQGKMYIDYVNEDVDPVKGDMTAIRQTEPNMLFNLNASKTIGNWKLYGGIRNIFNVVQNERHLDDAAFIYAPVYGRLWYLGLRIDIRHG
jgi:outer membrane receptor for ferrienterochelin and colicins